MSTVGTVKLITLGDVGVGKTAVSAAVYGCPVPAPGPTLGVDYLSRKWSRPVDGTPSDDTDTLLQLHCYDTSGQERFSGALTPTYIRSADVCMLVLDAASDDEFAADRLRHWYKMCTLHGPPSVRHVVVLNRSDTVPEDRRPFVSGPELGRALLVSGLQRYHVTCAVTGDGIDALRRDIIELAWKSHDARVHRSSVRRPRLLAPVSPSAWRCRRCC